MVPGSFDDFSITYIFVSRRAISTASICFSCLGDVMLDHFEVQARAWADLEHGAYPLASASIFTLYRYMIYDKTTSNYSIRQIS